MLNNEQIKYFMEKVNESVNWCTDGEINKLWKDVTGTIKIIAD